MASQRRVGGWIALSMVLFAGWASAASSPGHQVTAHHLALLNGLRDLMAASDQLAQLARDNPGADGDRLTNIVDALSAAVVAADWANEVANVYDDTTDSAEKARQSLLLSTTLTHTRSYVVRAELRAKGAVDRLTSPSLGAAGRKGLEALQGVDDALQEFAGDFGKPGR